MKFCGNCGKALEDVAVFCPNCGSRFVGATAANNQEPRQAENNYQQAQNAEAAKPATQKKPRKKWKTVFITILVCVLALGITAGVLVYRWYTSPEQRLLRALDAGNYEEAVSIMEEDDSVSDNKELENQLKARIANIKTGFADDTLEYASAKMELDTIRRLDVGGVSEELNEVQSFIDALNASRTDFATAESFFATGDYAEAIIHYQKVIEDDANYATALTQVTESAHKYREEILKKAAEYADSGLYTEAVALLNEALWTIPEDTKITEQIRIYEKDGLQKLKTDALSTAADYADRQDYLMAFQSLTSILNSPAADAEVLSAYNRYCEGYALGVIAEAGVMTSEKDFDGAIDLLQEGLRNLPGNENLTAKLEAVKAKQPVPITNMTAINSNDWGEWNKGTPTDPFGNDYSTACNYAIFDGYSLGISCNEEHYKEYRLYGKYSNLTGTISTHIDSWQDRINRLQIYADDVLIYTSPDLGRKTDAVDFSINVSGVEYIKIVVYTDAGASAILSNVQLWP